LNRPSFVISHPTLSRLTPRNRMAIPNRAAKITKAHKVLKKHYQPASAPTDRTLFEHLLYASCLENAPYEKADEAFARLQQLYFDWNEVRVTTISELAEVVAGLPNSATAATRLKRTLQSVFEAHYSFDLESLKKQNIGKAVKQLEGYQGVTPFAVSYVTQHALGGHAIPVDEGALKSLLVLGVIDEAEAKKNIVPGMERAVSKSKGIEFGSLLHQVGADFHASPHSTKVRAILLEIDPEAKDRFPKRGKKAEEVAATAPPPAAESKKKPAAKTTKADKPAAKAESQPVDGGKKKSASKHLARKKPR
jgi:endonuclease III